MAESPEKCKASARLSGLPDASSFRGGLVFQEAKWVVKRREHRDRGGQWTQVTTNEPESWPTVFLLMLE
jgi:hypothetical protein